MTTQDTKDPVTLDDLKRAIESVRPEPSIYPPDEPQCHDDWRQDWAVHHATRAAAWKVAFEWRDYFGGNVNRNCGCKSCREDCAEYDEGLRLIRKKLQS